MKIKIGVIGCLGRMGKAVINELITNERVKIAGAFARSSVGKDVGLIIGHGYSIGLKITNSINNVFQLSDVVIDFTAQECMLECLKAAVKFNKPFVSGTTGIDSINLQDYADRVPILWSANMSIGVNVLLKLVKSATKLLGDKYDVEILEMHHNLKKDSPSGTAVELGKTIAETLKIDFHINQYLYNNKTERQKDSIGFAVSRAGGVIGDHKVMFVNYGERIELSHKAISRKIFANGAVQAAMWLYDNKRRVNGLYSMQEVI
ncbi:4-hydroxy-tetrahydrodipicolinate reductase [Wolbachia endosymbiont of Chironomus riparius]|uniref:4-hydroxy-tetrahydrodipicolinate reductase n=1 Tax=Wolbachia endosymbiont of Chironomus riparius TaxID=2883238 RepID=UPI0020A22F11|nr:4-hydroxy-tetrahydrodipicolinate reductase [Wolbachia endosymbiont of Chironomus riparius]